MNENSPIDHMHRWHEENTKRDNPRNFLAVQWFGLCAFTAKGPASISGWGTKIPQAVRRSKINK